MYGRKNNNMGVIGEMKAQMNELRGMMKQVLEDREKRDPKNNGANSNGSASVDKSEVEGFLRAFVEAL